MGITEYRRADERRTVCRNASLSSTGCAEARTAYSESMVKNDQRKRADLPNMCKEMQQPVRCTRNGEDDLVEMDNDAFDHREMLLDLRERLMDSERQRLAGLPMYTLEDFTARMRARIDEAATQ